VPTGGRAGGAGSSCPASRARTSRRGDLRRDGDSRRVLRRATKPRSRGEGPGRRSSASPARPLPSPFDLRCARTPDSLPLLGPADSVSRRHRRVHSGAGIALEGSSLCTGRAPGTLRPGSGALSESAPDRQTRPRPGQYLSGPASTRPVGDRETADPSRAAPVLSKTGPRGDRPADGPPRRWTTAPVDHCAGGPLRRWTTAPGSRPPSLSGGPPSAPERPPLRLGAFGLRDRSHLGGRSPIGRASVAAAAGTVEADAVLSRGDP